jgi:prepilin-type N-terminal cleavage/methylation domain-containing protein
MEQDVNMGANKQKGLSLMELMVALVIMGIFAVSTVYYMSSTSDKARLRSATENLYGALTLIQSQAIARGKNIYFFTVPNDPSSGGTGCYYASFAQDATPDCADHANTGLPYQPFENLDVTITYSESASPQIIFNSSKAKNDIFIDMREGSSSSQTESFTLRSPHGSVAELRLESAGKMFVCSDDLTEYPSCA